jgi:hypothetical protein
VSPPDPGRVLRRALVGWGLGHLLLGRTTIGWALLAAEVASVLLVAWLAAGLANSNAYLVPYLTGAAFIVAWAWQAVDAYRSAARRQVVAPVSHPTPATMQRSAAAVIGWLSVPLLVWGTGFWLVAAHDANPAAVLDRFVTELSTGELDPAHWPASVIDEANETVGDLGGDAEELGDVRVRITSQDDERADALMEAIHYERVETTFLWVFPGTRLVPVADERLLALELVAVPVELPGGGEVAAVRWELVSADAGS